MEELDVSQSEAALDPGGTTVFVLSPGGLWAWSTDHKPIAIPLCVFLVILLLFLVVVLPIVMTLLPLMDTEIGENMVVEIFDTCNSVLPTQV